VNICSKVRIFLQKVKISLAGSHFEDYFEIMSMDRDQKLESLFARTHAGIKPGLELMLELLEALGNPQKDFLSVHVAGTNGKGSTCAMIESGIRQLGLKTGLFTSPHLVRVNERIRLSGKPASDDSFYGWLDQIQAVEGSLSRLPTFFETLSAMAFLGFKESGVQVAVLETGMGGRLDCTNVVEPLLSVVTRVDFDHQAFLGNTLAAIAGEKAGIIKPGRPVVIGSQDPEAEKVLCDKAIASGSVYRKAEDAVTLSGRKQDLKGQILTLSGTSADYGRMCLPLLGKFQLENLCTAVAALEVLEELLNLNAEPAWMKKAIESVEWAGRGQVLSVEPPVLLDVAHNVGGAKALRELLDELFGKKSKGVLFWAGLADKNPEEFIRILQPRFSACVCLDLQSPRAMSAEALALLAEKNGLSATCASMEEARRESLSFPDEFDFACVAGSVYLAGEWLSQERPDQGEMLSNAGD
jgi:dihydrofolate synthase/folylpolyglutamate synthase